MRHLDINALRDDLARGPLDAVDTAKYLAFQGELLSILFIPSPAADPADWPLMAFPMTALAGTYLCYRANGGAAGVRLAERYLAVSWVVGVRFAFVAIPCVLVAVVGHALLTVSVDGFDASPFAKVLDCGALFLVALVYWRIAVHLARIADLERSQTV